MIIKQQIFPTLGKPEKTAWKSLDDVSTHFSKVLDRQDGQVSVLIHGSHMEGDDPRFMSQIFRFYELSGVEVQ